MTSKLLESFRHFSWRLLGINSLKQEVETLQYFLNSLHKPSEIPQTSDPDLRIMQECDIILLAIVTKVLSKHNLSYWLDYGTLLGCVRHNGFIPWDDDMDISMTREDYCKAQTILKEELEPYGFTIVLNKQIGVGYQHEKTGIWLDIFANDSYYSPDNLEKIRGSLSSKICECGSLCRNKNLVTNEEGKLNLREKIIGGTTPQNGSNRYLYLCPEFSFPHSHFIFDSNWIFPLAERQMGEYSFSIPHNYISYLVELYGKGFMNFPKSGVLHHDLGRGQLSQWASKYNVDMNEIKAYLEKVLKKL